MAHERDRFLSRGDANEQHSRCAGPKRALGLIASCSPAGIMTSPDSLVPRSLTGAFERSILSRSGPTNQLDPSSRLLSRAALLLASTFRRAQCGGFGLYAISSGSLATSSVPGHLDSAVVEPQSATVLRT
jgi:hypothetical protein